MPNANQYRPPTELATIERAFARNLRAYVDGYRDLHAPRDVDMIEAAGGIAAFLGVGSPLTTVKGVPDDVTSELISEVEGFFRTHRVPAITVELAPWANTTTNDLLAARGYEVTGTEDVVTRIVGRGDVDLGTAPLEVISITADALVDISREGFEHGVDPVVDDLLGVSARLPGSVCLGVSRNGHLIACGQAAADGDVVIFGNDTTIPGARRLGAQTALIRARLAMADELAMAIAEVAPGSGSERNYLRCGFEIAYTRRVFSRRLD